MQLTKNVFIGTGFPGSNFGYVTTSQGIVEIESPERPADAVKWRKEIEGKGILRYLINTEPHQDHIAGDFFFDVPVISQEKAREAIQKINAKIFIQSLARLYPDNENLLKGYRIRIPSITFSEKMTLHLGNHSFHLINLPGHTLSQTAVYLPEEKVVFTGDNITYKVQGFLHEIEPASWLESLKKIGELDVEYIVPGHGEVCDKSYLKVQSDFIEASVKTIKDAMKRGWSREEAIKNIKSFPSPYSFDSGGQEIAPMLMGMAINRMYDLFS